MGVECPAVSQTTIARAPQLIAVEYRRLIIEGSQRLVSSVTYITSRPRDTANLIALSEVCSKKSSVQPSVYRRMGLEPMNVAASIFNPVRSEISAIGRMSFSWVRAAQFGRIFIRF